LAGSIKKVLPVAFISTPELTSVVGGVAAAIAIGAFLGQTLAVVVLMSDRQRREVIAAGGITGLLLMIGFILLSAKWG
jgi:hypothetical protein